MPLIHVPGTRNDKMAINASHMTRLIHPKAKVQSSKFKVLYFTTSAGTLGLMHTVI